MHKTTKENVDQSPHSKNRNIHTYYCYIQYIKRQKYYKETPFVTTKCCSKVRDCGNECWATDRVSYANCVTNKLLRLLTIPASLNFATISAQVKSQSSCQKFRHAPKITRSLEIPNLLLTEHPMRNQRKQNLGAR